MHQFPSISVVIPTYNRARIVTQAIESVLAQELPASEIIVVDDGSKDDTLESLAAYGDRIRIVSRPNTGISGARNDGIKAAGSDWVAFLDDDDEYTPERLRIAADAIRKYPDAVVHASNILIKSQDSPAASMYELRGKRAEELMLLERPLEWVLSGCFFVQATVCRRSELQKIGGFRNDFYEDLDLLARMTVEGPWTVDHRCSLHLIRRPGEDLNLSSLWRSKPVENYEALTRIHREVLRFPSLSGTEKRLVESGLATNLFELGRALHAHGETTRARECFLEAGSRYPKFHSRAKAHMAAYFGTPALRMLGALRRRQGVFRSVSTNS